MEQFSQQYEQMARLIAGGMSQHHAHALVVLSDARSSANQIVMRPAFRQRLQELRGEDIASPTQTCEDRLRSDRDAALSMLAGLIAEAMDAGDRQSANTLVECFAKVIRSAT